MKTRALTLILLFSGMIFTASAGETQPRAARTFAVIKLEGTVNPVMAEHIVDSIKKAPDDNHSFIIIPMDTPGGLMTSMQDIIKGIMGSKLPVVVYTSPRGAQAASAGGYIMLSAHVAAMAPGTRVGAMSPMNIMEMFSSKKDDKAAAGDDVMKRKIMNDSIAYARSLAQERGRNVGWAERAVRDAVSSTYSEALRLGVIDIVAEDMPDLLRQLNGRRITLDGRPFTFATGGAEPREYLMTWQQRFLNFFSDPQVIFFLLIIAIAGIGMEFKSPGMIIPGVVGVIAFFIFLMAVRVLPINIAGIILIVLAMVLFVLELKITSYGLFTVGGIISFVVGAMILFDNPLPGFSVPWPTIIGVGLFVLGFVFVLIRLALLAHKGRVVTGAEGMAGEHGLVIKDFERRGPVTVHGEIWTARADVPLKKGDRVVVEKIEGMVLVVKKSEE
jgi:membrane-bound serine protease (ClpP class)